MSEDQAPADEHPPDAATALGLAVVSLALAGICALLGDHFLLGALRLAAGVLAGTGLGVLLLALLGRRLRRRTRRLLAGALALVVALALTVPAVHASRVGSLESAAAAEIAPLGEGDKVASAPNGQGPVLVRRADGTAQLVGAGAEASEVEAAPDDVLALSSDGTRLVQVTGEVTRVHELGGGSDAAGDGSDAPDGGAAPVELPGQSLALSGDTLVLRACEDGVCRVRGVDLTAPDEPLWTVMDAEETRGPDQAGLALPARAEAPPGLLDAVAATGVLPSVPLRFDPAQGWLQIDAATGFPVGRVLAPADADCRIAATPAPPDPQSVQEQGPLVLTACSGEDGALTATAFRDGVELWESAPSPPGTWSARLEHGRVLATGTEEGTEVEGEIIASERQADWTAPGGDGVAQAARFTTRIGIDGERMVVANESGQLVAYDTAAGTNPWTLPLPSGGDGVRGALGEGTAAVLDPVERTAPLAPRGAQRLRVVHADSGEVLVDERTTQDVMRLDPVGGGRALVTLEGRTVLLGR